MEQGMSTVQMHHHNRQTTSITVPVIPPSSLQGDYGDRSQWRHFAEAPITKTSCMMSTRPDSSHRERAQLTYVRHLQVEFRS